MKIFIVSNLLPLKSLISFEQIRTIKNGIRRNSKLKQTKKKCINIKYTKKINYRPKSNDNAAHITIMQLTVLNDFVTKHTLKLTPWASARVHWKILPSEKLKIYFTPVITILFPRCFLKQFIFPCKACEMTVQVHIYTNFQALKMEIKTGSKADAWYTIITNLLLKSCKILPTQISGFRLRNLI